MTDTPRTDGFMVGKHYSPTPGECMDFAAELERELAREKQRAEDNGKLAHDTAIQLAERALADRLGSWMEDHRKAWVHHRVDPDCDCDDCAFLVPFDEALAAWKEARRDS